MSDHLPPVRACGTTDLPPATLPHRRTGKHLTTGQVARLCGVAPRTVSKWIDAGQLRGYRIPGSQDRRVHPGDLVRFCRRHGLPVPDEIEGGGPPVVLVAGAWAELAGRLRWFLPDDLTRLVLAGGAFDAGVMVERHCPRVAVLVFAGLGRLEALGVAGKIRADPEWRYTKLVAVAADDEPQFLGLTRSSGFDAAFRASVDPGALANAVREFAFAGTAAGDISPSRRGKRR